MDIREIQALHAQYSSQPIVIDINSHVRALPAPAGQESTRQRVSARLGATCRRLGRPTAIVVAITVGAGLGGISVAKLWRVLQAPHAVSHTGPAAARVPSAAPAQSAATAVSATVAAGRPLTSADFAEHSPAELTRVDTQALRAASPGGSPAPAAPETDQEKAAASPIRASRVDVNAAANQKNVAVAQDPPAKATASSPAASPAQPTAQQPEQAKPVPHRIHRAPARQRPEPAAIEATATAPHNEPAKTDHPPKLSTPAKTGDVPLF